MQHIILFLLSFLWQMSTSVAQYSNPLNFDFLETTSERDKFLMYIDSIDKYLYRDAQLVEKIILECEIILQTPNELSNEDLLKYATQKIYIEQNNTHYLDCYQIIKDSEHLLEDPSISKKIKDNFIYIRAYTYMSLEDLATAQKAFYEILEEGRLKKDTGLIVTSLYSLGQLYGDEKDHESALKCYKEIQAIEKKFKIRPSTLSLVDYEMGEIYFRLEQHEKALNILEKGINFLDTHKIDRLKPDFLFLQ